MNEITLVLGLDLHARPVASLASAVRSLGFAVTLERPGGPAIDAEDMLRVMALHLCAGETVVLRSVPPSPLPDSLRALFEAD